MDQQLAAADADSAPTSAPMTATLASAVAAGALPAPASPTQRHDAFTGELMARFCEVLAETGIVSDACRAVGKNRDTAYAHRRRNPLFAAAWAGALSHARNRLADSLLERSIEGSVDYLYRDGELVGERRYIDNRLAYAMLRRLDKQAEAEPAPVAAELARGGRGGNGAQPSARDWGTALKALRSGSEEDLCAALAAFGPETDKTDTPPDPDSDAVGFYDEELDRAWRDEDSGRWRTSFPPPPGFAGDEQGCWQDEGYERACTAEECALLDARERAELHAQRAEEDAERDTYFAQIRAELGCASA